MQSINDNWFPFLQNGEITYEKRRHLTHKTSYHGNKNALTKTRLWQKSSIFPEYVLSVNNKWRCVKKCGLQMIYSLQLPSNSRAITQV